MKEKNMSSSRIRSPGQPQNTLISRQRKSRRTRSLSSNKSNNSLRLTAVISDSFKMSPLPMRQSVLNDNTDIEVPEHNSWWKRLGENSRDLTSFMEERDNNDNPVQNKNIEDEFDVEILSQEKENLTLDLPESSDNESIHSIVIPQRVLFTNQNVPTKKKFEHLNKKFEKQSIMNNRESMTIMQKSNFIPDEDIDVQPKKLFSQATKSKTKNLFTTALLNTTNKNVNKSVEKSTRELRGQVRNLFGNRPDANPKSNYANFILTDSEDEIPDIEPRHFGFQRRSQLKQRRSSASHGTFRSSTSNVTDVEMDDWQHLPSSTMFDSQLEVEQRISNILTIEEVKSKAFSSCKEINRISSLKVQHHIICNESLKTNSRNSMTISQVEDVHADKTLTAEHIQPVVDEIPGVVENENLFGGKGENENTFTKQVHQSAKDVDNENISLIFHYEDDVMDVAEKNENTKTTSNATIHKNNNNNEDCLFGDNEKKTNSFTMSQTATNHNIVPVIAFHTNKDCEKINNTGVNICDESQKKMCAKVSINKDKHVEKLSIIKEGENKINTDKEITCEKYNTRECSPHPSVQEFEFKKHGDNEVNNKEKNYEQCTIMSPKSKTQCIEENTNHIKEIVNASENCRKEENRHQNFQSVVSEAVTQNYQSIVKEAETQNYQSVINEAETTNCRSVVKEPEIQPYLSVVNEAEIQNCQLVVNEAKTQDYQPLLNKTGTQNYKLMLNETETQNCQSVVNEPEFQPDQSVVIEPEIQNCQLVLNDAKTLDCQLLLNKGETQNNKSVLNEEETPKCQLVLNEAETRNYQSVANESDTQNYQLAVNKSKTNREELIPTIEHNEKNKNSQQNNETNNTIEQEKIKQVDPTQNIINKKGMQNDRSNIIYQIETDDNDKQLNNVEHKQVNQYYQENLSSHEGYENKIEEVNEDTEDMESDKEIDDFNQQDVLSETLESEIAPEHDSEEQNDSESEQHIDDEDEINNEDLEIETEGMDCDYNSDNEIMGEQDHNINSEEQLANFVQGDTEKTEERVSKYPEAVLYNKTHHEESMTVLRRNTSINKRQTMPKELNLRPSLCSIRESIDLSQNTINSSAEGSVWDSHRATRKTLRQTFGKDFTPRKSLRTLVMERSARRNTNLNGGITNKTDHQIDANEIGYDTIKNAGANSTEIPEIDDYQDLEPSEADISVESDHEASRILRQTTLERYLQKIKQDNAAIRTKVEEKILNSFRVNTREKFNLFKMPEVPKKVRRPSKPMNTLGKSKTKVKQNEMPSNVKPKPPKKFNKNAPWITKRLQKYLEDKLEPKYNHTARVRAEKLIATLYEFVKQVRRNNLAKPLDVDTLRLEMARLGIVRTHYQFYNFFHEFMPREIRLKVNPDIMNKIPMPDNIFGDIIPEGLH